MKSNRSRSGTGGLTDELAELRGVDATTLRQRWRVLYRTEAPVLIGHALLLQAVAYRLQEGVLGGASQRSLARRERAGLLLATPRGSLDQGRGLACVGFVLEAKQRRVSSAHHLRHHEAHIDPRIADRFGDRVAKPRSIVALDQQGGDGRRGEPARCAAATDFLPETGCSSIPALFSPPP